MSSEPQDRWQLRILHIKDRIEKIKSFTEGLTYEAFTEDAKTVEAVIRCFQVMGDAAKNIPDDVKKKYPAVSWREMAQFRDKIVHDYDQVDLSVVWKTLKDRLPALEKELAKIPVSKENL
jgi:uncharacterized protein with HEPN domain